MATSSCCVTANGAELYKHCASNSRLIGFNARNRSSKLFLTRTSDFRGVKRCFHVKSVSSEPKQKVQDPVTEEGAESVLSSFAPDAASVASSIRYHAEFTPLFSPERFELPKAFFATAQSVRDSLLINWNATYDFYEKMNMKQAYYLSMEFLQGRALLNAIGNLELTGSYAEALKNLGHNLENVASQEPDAALGNGGLGRLASCFLDSLATLDYPAWGYGLRYKYGLFKQQITKDGQEEVAEDWLELGSPWEIVRNDVSYPIKFYGKVTTGSDGKRYWIGGEDIKAVAYDVPIPGYKTKTTINLRLWSTQVPSGDFDLSAFNSGEHTKACEAQANAEKICYILYPGDGSVEGKILRLKQQYTLCSASLQDIIARFERRSGDRIKWEEFPEKVAVQMNDTHPTLCIPELMRILIDLKGLSWKEAWNITKRTVAYTNHTVLPEALEKWSYELMEKLLPRHVEIIQMIDEELVHEIVSKYGSLELDKLEKKLAAMRILENFDLPSSVADLFTKPERLVDADTETVEVSDKVEVVTNDELVKNGEYDTDKKTSVKPELGAKDIDKKTTMVPEPAVIPPKMVRMANLCVVGGHAVNGVAEIHSEIVKEEVFNEFYELWPEKFQNKTNGVTPRRWIRFCNPPLSSIITKWTGTEDWVLNTEKLAELQQFADNEDLQIEWREAKRSNKIKAVSFLKEKTGYSVIPDAMFDIQVKRIHEYKRLHSAMDSLPVNWEALDSLIIDFVKSENLMEDSLSPPTCPSSSSSSSYQSRLLIRQIRRSVECGDIDTAIDLLRVHAPSLLDDHRLLFCLQKQRFIELLRKRTAEDRESAINCLRESLAPCALDAYPEAYEEFKHILLALVYDEDDKNSPVANEWSPKRRIDIAGLLSSVLRAHLCGYDPLFAMSLRYLISIHKLFCFRQGVPSPISDLTQRLLLEDRDPPATPLESFYEAPPFDEVDIQALAHAVEITRQGAIDSLRFAKGDLYQAFQNELCRIRLDDPMFDELVHEYCVYRGFIEFSVVDSPGMQLDSGSISNDQSECEHLSNTCSTEVEYGNTKLSGSGTSATQVIMEGSPESNTNLVGIQSTDTEERYPSETSHGDCSTSWNPQFEKVLQKNRCLRVGETNKRKRWRGRHEKEEFVSGPTNERSREELNASSSIASTSVLKDQQVSPKSCFPNMMKNKEEKYELVLGLQELASRGMAVEVVEEINEMDPNFFVQNPALLFQLKQVEFLNLAGSGNHTQALRVACSFLGPLASSHPDLLKPLKETLLALLKPNEEAFNERLPLCALANSLQVAIGRRFGIEEPQLMKIIRATLYTHSEWFKLQMCKDRFEGLLRIDALKEFGGNLIIDAASRLDVDTSGDGSQVTGSSNNRKQEDGSPTQSSARDVGCDESAILKVMEFLALPRADAIHLLAQYNGNAETVIQQIFA